jgi:hypothetical protein
MDELHILHKSPDRIDVLHDTNILSVLTQKSAVYCWRNEAMIALAGKHF